MFTHFSALLGGVVPMANIIAPIVIWQMKKEDMPLVDDQGKEVLNFQISLTIYIGIAVVLCFIPFCFPMYILLAGLGIFGLIMTLIGGIKANEGEAYRYPLCIRLIR